MRNSAFILLVVLLFTGFNSFSQVVDGITYQAVALDYNGNEIPGIDLNGNIISENQLMVRFTIIRDFMSGTIVYQEENATTTDQYGLFTLVIGHGLVTNISPVSNLLEVKLGEGKHFLKVEIDFGNSEGYVFAGIQQMMAVPYALYALNSGNGNDGDTLSTNELQQLAISEDTVFLSQGGGFVVLPANIYFSGDYNDLLNKPDLSSYLVQEIDGDSTNELQNLTIYDYRLYLSNGNEVTLPDSALSESQVDVYVSNNGYLTEEVDGDTLNELQTLSFSGDTIYLSDGGLIALPEFIEVDGDTTNELQTLSILGDTIYLTDGGKIALPEFIEVDGDTLNEIQTLSFSGDTIYLSDGGGAIALPDYIEVDGDTLNELQTLLVKGDSLEISDGNTVRLPDTTLNEAEVDAFVANNGYITSEADGDPENELQTLSISNDTIYISDGNGVAITSSTVAFAASGSVGSNIVSCAQVLSDGGRIIFNDSPEFNIGNAYNNSDGYFTAPYQGLYQFNATVYTGNLKTFVLQVQDLTVRNFSETILLDNGLNVAGLTLEYRSNGSFVLSLNAGDKVSVIHVGSNPNYEDDTGCYPFYFSGNLIK
jgi:hypothetical protein